MDKPAEYHGSLDSLPDSILCHILSFMPTKDAVRTSILSPRWRYLFASSISKLDFNDCLPDSRVPKEHINFKKFVDRLFFNPKYIRLECFRVNDRWVYDDSVGKLHGGFLSIYNWLSSALWRGVKEIGVHIGHGGFRHFPTHMFTCSSLVTLKLHINSSEMRVPIDVCLPNLRTLHLSNMEFVDGCSFPRLISGCPVLEDLGVFNCFLNDPHELNIHSLSLKRLVLDYESSLCITPRRFDSVIVIDAPCLVDFKYFCFVVKGYSLRNMGSLEKADITIFHFRDGDHEQSTRLLQEIRNVQALHLTIHDYVRPLIRTPPDSVLTFPNLVELEFKNPHRDCNVSVTTWIVEFLHCCPNLNTLILDLDDSDRVFGSTPEEVPSCLLYHLKEISIVSFRKDTQVFEMISYFLNHALVLEKLVMKNIDISQECRLSIIEKLSSLPMKSKKCEFVIG